MGRGTGSWWKRWRVFAASLALVSVTGLVGSAVAVADDGGNGSWPMIGHDPFNSFSSNSGPLGVRSVGRLAPRWVATTTGDVSATPAVVDGAATGRSTGARATRNSGKVGDGGKNEFFAFSANGR